MQNRSDTTPRAARAIRSCSARSSSSRTPLSAIACRSSGGCRNPVTPCWITSGSPPTADATTGTSHAIASSAARPKLSCADGSRNRSATESSATMSSCSPRNSASPISPADVNRSCARCASGPSPTSSSRAFTRAAHAPEDLDDRVHALHGAEVGHVDDEVIGAAQQLLPQLRRRAAAVALAVEEVRQHVDRHRHAERAVGVGLEALRHGRHHVRLPDAVGHRLGVARVAADDRDVGAVERRDDAGDGPMRVGDDLAREVRRRRRAGSRSGRGRCRAPACARPGRSCSRATARTAARGTAGRRASRRGERSGAARRASGTAPRC